MKTKKQLQKKVAKLQARIDAMPDEPAKTGVIYDMPDEGTEVHSMTGYGGVNFRRFERGSHESYLNQGALFHDKESALNAGKVRAIRHRLAGFCAKAWEDAGEAIDWHNRTQKKYGLVYNHARVEVGVHHRYIIEADGYYLPSSDLTKLKEAFTDDELKLALTGKL